MLIVQVYNAFMNIFEKAPKWAIDIAHRGGPRPKANRAMALVMAQIF